MLTTTSSRLACPRTARKKSCGGELAATARVKEPLPSGVTDIVYGELQCRSCRARFPILAGVAIVVEKPFEYLLTHAKGVARLVPEKELPREVRAEFRELLAELAVEHIEEDLEAARVVALYVMNHYLRASGSGEAWWEPRDEQARGSALIGRLIREYWDRGPMDLIERWVADLPVGKSVVELGCSVGGLLPRLAPRIGAYLGVDTSFASVAIGRHLALGAPYPAKIQVPEDLLHGPVSRPLGLGAPERPPGPSCDLIVTDLTASALRAGGWDLAIALNAIDMMDEPAELPRLQSELLVAGGLAIQSCPYIWHEAVARRLRAALPKKIRDSAHAVEWLYAQEGLATERTESDVPWLFFKHVRQLEIYSAHVFLARKSQVSGRG